MMMFLRKNLIILQMNIWNWKLEFMTWNWTMTFKWRWNMNGLKKIYTWEMYFPLLFLSVRNPQISLGFKEKKIT
jgi:hypothetical protein